MRWMLAATLTVTAVATGRPDDPTKTDLDAIQGEWKIVSGEADDKPAPEGMLAPKLTFKGDKLIGLGPDMTIKLDPAKKPKHIDITVKRGDTSITVPAIYELKKDEFTLAIPLTEKSTGVIGDRPANFETKGKPILVMKYKRSSK